MFFHFSSDKRALQIGERKVFYFESNNLNRKIFVLFLNSISNNWKIRARKDEEEIFFGKLKEVLSRCDS